MGRILGRAKCIFKLAEQACLQNMNIPILVHLSLYQLRTASPDLRLSSQRRKSGLFFVTGVFAKRGMYIIIKAP